MNRTRVVLHILLAIGWTVLLGVLMLSPGKATFAEDVSRAFGGTDLTDAIGHVILTAVETALVFNALRLMLPLWTALGAAAVFTAILGVLLELAQLYIPYRGVSVLDFSANALGVVLCVAVVVVARRRMR